MRRYSFTDPAILEENCWPKVEACYSRTWDRYEMQPHFHNRAEIMYVLKGWCLLHLFEYQMDSATQTIRITRKWTERLTAGEFIFVDQGVLHDLAVPETNYMLNAEFCILKDASSLMSIQNLAQNSPLLSALLDKRKRTFRGKDDSSRLMHALENVIAYFSKSGAKDTALQDVLMAELLLRLADSMKDNSIKANTLSYASKAMDYIAEHLSEEIRVEDIARLVGIAPSYLQRLFKQATDMTIIEYVNRLRIERSKKLLMHMEDPIVDVAIAAGFNSRQHFFRVFHSLVGMSPQQFRQEQGFRKADEVYLFENVDDHSYDSDGNQMH